MEDRKFFLAIDIEPLEWREVTKEQFIKAERNAGFWPKVEGEVATGSFGGRGVVGRTEYIKLTPPTQENKS